MEAARHVKHASTEPVRVTNREGRWPLVLICDHASNFLPARIRHARPRRSELLRHIAWDPGAQPVALRMAEALDAVLVKSCVSRLSIDCNRPLDAPDLIPPVSETTPIPGNARSRRQRARARASRLLVAPFHAAIEEVVSARLAAGGRRGWCRSIPSRRSTRASRRPWQIGIIHDDDRRLAAPLIAALRALKASTVGVNEPYSPADRVYFTLERHARSRGLPCAMIEIRNDEIADEAGQRKWADLLTGILPTSSRRNVREEPTTRDRKAGQPVN